MESWQLPHGMRPAVQVTCVQCAACGVMGGLVLDGQPLLPMLDQVGAHIREHHPAENALDALQLVRDVAYPPAGRDVTAWVSEYNERAGRSL
ncbi:hypothetical protein [Streptomyces sp. NPDC058613]|uniref:hypothetical protein n=1 Tax=Streptomyces sp. NPDC058613 TaxID=3346556 RepID=UPI0036639DCD